MLVAEDARIEHHLAGAMRVLLARDVTPLPRAVRRVRDLVIRGLDAYRRARRFPRNHALRKMTPVFIDEHGTRCAMAHLLELVGADALVARVAQTNNLARIHDLANDPELLAWLAAMGLTVDEAARIQPTYCWYKRLHCYCPQVDQPASAVVTAAHIGYSDAGVPQHRVEKVIGGSGVAVGDVLTQYVSYSTPSAEPAERVLAIYKSDASVGVTALPKDWFMSGDCRSIAAAFPLTVDEAAAAVLSPTCSADLTAKNPQLAESICAPYDGGPTGSEASPPPFDSAPMDSGSPLDTAVIDTETVDTAPPLADSGTGANDVAEANPVIDAPPELVGRGCEIGHVAFGAAPVAFLFTAAVLARRRLQRR